MDGGDHQGVAPVLALLFQHLLEGGTGHCAPEEVNHLEEVFARPLVEEVLSLFLVSYRFGVVPIL